MSARPRPNPWLLSGILLVPLLLWTTWPMAVAPRSELLGDGSMEAVRHLWALWAALLDGPMRVETSLINFPAGVRWVLAGQLDLLPFVLGYGLGGPALGWNLVLLTNLMLAALGVALLIRVRLGGRAPLWMAPLVVGMAPLVHNLHTGMIEGLAVGWVALSLAGLLWALRAGGAGRLLLAGLGCGLAAWAGAYVALFAAVALGVQASWLLVIGPRRGQRAARLLVVGLVAALVAAAPLWLSLFQRSADLPGGVSGLAQVLSAPDLPQNRMLGADPLAIVWPVDQVHAVYLGLPLLLLAAVGARRAPGLALGAGALLLLGMGLYLHSGGAALRLGRRVLLLPAGWLAVLFEPISHVTRLYRAVAAAGVLLLPLAAAGVEALSERVPASLRRVLPGLVMLTLLMDQGLLAPIAWPRPRISVRQPAIYEQLPDGAPVLEVPLPRAMGRPGEGARDLALLEQVRHGHPLGGNPHTRQPLDPRVERLAEGLQEAITRQDPGACQRARAVAAHMGFGWVLIRAGEGRRGWEPEARCLGTADVVALDGRAWRSQELPRPTGG